ncbi:dihydrodipicolinate synthase family protein [Shewanella gaetbuli]|uniref:Dihydrodipicolinate synthase family protein n=1 Tax=Shewanella gaetbuli TaxID=220752 RepID=A0A9X1ZNI5_9GAMM|nr:dihydrodipicolinate synthase family protein [Shewanella gaetbuli]MCL1143160.1 dihydrodipicolinate synthase family protein [Shewanella gaetbuli]
MNLSGIISYPITPFTQDGKNIDFNALGLSLESLLEQGSDAIAPLGSTGESAYLSTKEWREVAEYTVKKVNKRVPVIVGISELTTEAAVENARFAQQVGADAVMVIPVSYWKLTELELFDYYQAISDAISIPIMAYNNPATSGIDMSPELLVKMFHQIPNVTMVKESTGDIQRMHKIKLLSEGKLPFFNGCNTLALEALCAGASGWCTAAPNLLGVAPKHLYEQVKAGELNKAQTLFYQQLPTLTFIVGVGIPKVVKAGLKLLGRDVGLARKPLGDITEQQQTQLKALIHQFVRGG